MAYSHLHCSSRISTHCSAFDLDRWWITTPRRSLQISWVSLSWRRLPRIPRMSSRLSSQWLQRSRLTWHKHLHPRLEHLQFRFVVLVPSFSFALSHHPGSLIDGSVLTHLSCFLTLFFLRAGWIWCCCGWKEGWMLLSGRGQKGAGW